MKIAPPPKWRAGWALDTEYGFSDKKAGAVCVDLTAAYDTVWLWQSNLSDANITRQDR